MLPIFTAVEITNFSKITNRGFGFYRGSKVDISKCMGTDCPKKETVSTLTHK